MKRSGPPFIDGCWGSSCRPPIPRGSFKLDEEPLRVFTQWVEILPTDQIVAIDYKPDNHL